MGDIFKIFGKLCDYHHHHLFAQIKAVTMSNTAKDGRVGQ